MKVEEKEFKLDLDKSNLVIAMAQLEGPIPRGKRKVVINGRESYEWTSLDETSARLQKAYSILKFLNTFPKKVDLVVFPEYSLPLEDDEAIVTLQGLSTEYNQVIVAGADTIRQPNSSLILNQSAIFIPAEEEPIWVTKRQLSRWETGYVDSPEQVSVPVFTWEEGRDHYWMRVYICSEFPLVVQEIPTSGSEPDLGMNRGPGLLIVPMCSPEVHSFRTYADLLLRREEGTATILCNCIGETGAVGFSSVITVLPDGRSLQPALELRDNAEAVAVFELDLKGLAPHKKSRIGERGAVGNRYLYDVQTMPDGFGLVAQEPDSETSVEIEKGVINPAIFDLFGKKMRVSFLSVHNYAETQKRVKDLGFEVLAVLGQHDLIVTHIHEASYDMVIDIKQAIDLRSYIQSPHHESLPYFQVYDYYKVLGVPIGPEEQTVFEGFRALPTEDELVQILTLGNNWNDESVSAEVREVFLNKKWILACTTRKPADINAIMTIYIHQATGSDLTERIELFKENVLPIIIRKTVVTSVYSGIGRNMEAHFVLRLTTDPKSLFTLINEIYQVSLEARVLISTMTYVVIEKLSTLSLRDACLLTVLPSGLKIYRDNHFLPLLTEENKKRARYMPQETQTSILGHFKKLEAAINFLGEPDWLERFRENIMKKFATGLLLNDFVILRDPHDILHGRVEDALLAVASESISDEQLDDWRAELNIKPGKTMLKMTMYERIALINRGVEEGQISPEIADDLSMLAHTVSVRNALAHNRKEELNNDRYVAAVAIYCRFLSTSDTGEK